MKTVKIILGSVLFLTIITGSSYAYTYVEVDPGLNKCLTDGDCKGKCVDDVEGGKTCRLQSTDQDCSGTGKA